MTARLIEFEWCHDPEGYRLVEADSGRPQRIVGGGGPPVFHRPLDKTRTLFLVFARSAVTAAGVLQFIQQYGPLTRQGLIEGESVPAVIREAQKMADLLGYYYPGRRSRARRLALPYVRLGTIDAYLELETRTKRPQLELSPSDLLAGLWLQLAEEMSQGMRIHQCKHCGTWFEAGPATGRRGDAEYCSREHQIKFNSLKRRKGR